MISQAADLSCVRLRLPLECSKFGSSVVRWLVSSAVTRETGVRFPAGDFFSIISSQVVSVQY